MVNRVWKEMYSPDDYKTDSDPLGADDVNLTLNGKNLVAHRIQVKMGKARRTSKKGKESLGGNSDETHSHPS